MHNVEIDKARGFLYNILSLLFVEENVKNNTPKIIECLEILSNNAFDDEVAMASNDILEYCLLSFESGFIKVFVKNPSLFSKAILDCN